MKNQKLIYWISTGIMSIVFLFGVSLFIFTTEDMKKSFEIIGFPAWMMIPLGIFEVLGVLAVLTKKSNLLKNLAYGGLLLASSHGLAAHLIANDGGFAPALVAIIFTITSWIYDRKLYPIQHE